MLCPFSSVLVKLKRWKRALSFIGSTKLFMEMDTNKTGKVNKGNFVEYVLKNHSTDIAIKSFYETVNEELCSKSEKIILKLKKLREKEYVKNDMETLSDVNWYY